jgi:hypothetical protein
LHLDTQIGDILGNLQKSGALSDLKIPTATAAVPMSRLPGPYYSSPIMPPTIQMDTPQLPNVPTNNRIFVEGKAYEVSLCRRLLIFCLF